MSWCRVCRYHLFGACPKPELQDPPQFPVTEGGEKAIAAAKPQPPPAGQPEITLDGQPSGRLTRGQL